MALPSSFIAGKTWADVLTDDHATALDLSSTTAGAYRCSLWMNTETGTPTVDEETTTTPYGTDPWAATTNHWNEWTKTGYTAGGGTPGYLTNPTVTSASTSRKIVWNDGATSVLWTGLSGGAADVRGVLISAYQSGSPYRPMVLINFGAGFDAVSGDFEITWDTTNGIVAWSY